MAGERTTLEIVKTFAADTILAGFLFLIVYFVAVGISEIMQICFAKCQSIESTQKIFAGVKWVMLCADFIMMVAFIYRHTCTALDELEFSFCKGQ